MLATCQYDYEIDEEGDESEEEAEARDREIELRAAALILPGEECYPLEALAAAMALEAVPERVSAPTFRHLQKAKEAERTNHPDAFEAHAVAFTRGMIALLYDHWGEKAQQQATNEIR